MTSPASPRKFSKHDIMLGAGNLRFDRDLRVGWDIEPSIGLVAKDVMRMALGISSYKEPLTRAVKEVMVPSFIANFSQGGRPEKWKPLAAFTLEVKSLAGSPYVNKPLMRTSALLRAVSQVKLWDIGNTSATVRSLPSEVWYGAIHQGGYGGFGVYMSAAKRQLGPGASPTAIRKLAFSLNDAARGGVGKVAGAAGIPQRQFIMYQEDDIDDIQEIFVEWLTEQTIVLGRFTR